MDFQSSSHTESGKLEQIVSQFLLKSLHIILDSRIPSLHRGDRSGEFQSSSGVKKSDKWFNLVLGDRPAALGNLNFWQRNIMDPMIIDIIAIGRGSTSSSVDNFCAASAEGRSFESVIERWIIQYKNLGFPAPQTGETSSSSYKRTYKKSIILLRSLYSQMRFLPAYRIFRQLSSSSHTYNFDIIYKVSSFCEPFSRSEEDRMKEYSFVPVEALPGHLSVSVTYRPSLSDIHLEPLSTFPAKIITDYVGSPTTDPFRAFPSSERGVRATSFPLRGVQAPNATPLQRPHSWTSGFHRAAQFMVNQSIGVSPPAYGTSHMPYNFPSSPTNIYGYKDQSHRPPTHKKIIGFDEYQLSPPFSPSISPSTPTYFSNSNHMQDHMTSETAPVSIPLPLTGRSLRYVSPNFSDPSKSSLPPLSPKSTRYDPSSQESPSSMRSIKKLESLRTGELNSSMANQFSGHKILKDSKDESGRFSGLLSSSGSPCIGFSRSSSRLSFQDDLDDGDFSCPFDVDDVDISDSPNSRSLDAKGTSDSNPHSLLMGIKSQDAAVGVLVHMLRTAPPLRQDRSCYSSHLLRTNPDEEVATASGFFMPKKTADALEELRSYRDMKDLLLSKSGTRIVSKEEH